MRSSLKFTSLATAALLSIAVPKYPLSNFQATAIAQTSQDRKTEGDRVLQQCWQDLESQQYEAALRSCNEALAIFQQLKNPGDKAAALNNLGEAYRSLSQDDKAISYYQQALPLFQQLKDKSGEAAVLNNLGLAYWSLSQSDKAISYYQQALPLFQQLKDKNGEAAVLNNLGLAYRSLSQYDKAIAYSQQALPLFQQLKDKNGEAQALTNLGNAYWSLSQYDKAIAYSQQALPLFQQLKDKNGEAQALMNLGNAYESLSQYEKAIAYYQQALTIFVQVKDRTKMVNVLTKLGNVYSSLSNYTKAIQFHEQSLAIAREIKDRQGEGIALGNLGLAYYYLARYHKAIQYQEQSLAIAREIKDRQGEGSALGDLGNAYFSLNDYTKAIQYHEQSLAIAREIKDQQGEANALGNLGIAYFDLGNYPKAIQYHEQSLAITREIKDRRGEAACLGNLGNDYKALGNYPKAIQYHEQSLAIAREIKDRQGEGQTLGNLAIVHRALGNYPKAMQYHEQRLAITREIKDRQGEGQTLGNLGNVYSSLGNYAKAMQHHEQSLAIAREIKDREGESIALNNIGNALKKTKQLDLAIIFYKQAVIILESIRQDARPLSRELQASYTESVSITYRSLADLLLQQNRVIEAMQVLDLLKVQDLQDFLKDVRGDALTAQGVELLPQETAILQAFDASQKQSLDTLLKNPTIQTQVQSLQRTAAEQNLTLNAYQDLQTRINKLGDNIALFYPLILDDRLELVVLTKDRPPIHKPVAISRKELETEIQTFRQQLQARSPKIKEPAQQLYQRLIQPIEVELRAAGVETIVYAPDSIMRYIPLAALHDGNQWLAQRYQINYLTALVLTPLDKPATSSPQVFAGAVTKEYSPIINGQKYPFPALSQTQTEVEQLAQRYPNTQLLIDDRLNRQAIETNLSNSNIVHLATHAAFLSGSPDASFILLGDGSTLSLRDLSTFQLPNVSLFVLSACETALGEKLGNGIEIFGFGYQLQRNQVRASLASLWQVSDGGTQVLMNRFYEQLKQGKTVAKAMQQVQQDFLDRKVTSQEMQQIRASARPHVDGGVPTDLSHPYYWAPFILIGNGL